MQECSSPCLLQLVEVQQPMQCPRHALIVPCTFMCHANGGIVLHTETLVMHADLLQLGHKSGSVTATVAMETCPLPEILASLSLLCAHNRGQSDARAAAHSDLLEASSVQPRVNANWVV